MGSDLESGAGAGSSDLKEMMAVGSNSNVNVIVTTGGANKDDAAQGGINWRKINRWKVEQGKMTNIPYTPSSQDHPIKKIKTSLLFWVLCYPMLLKTPIKVYPSITNGMVNGWV
jgi:hypothetical protein